MICSSGGVGRSAHWRRAVAQNEQAWRRASAMGQREVQQRMQRRQVCPGWRYWRARKVRAGARTADAAGRKIKAAVVRAVQGAQRQCQQQTRAWWGCRYGRKLERRRAALGQPDDYGGAASTQQATAPTSPARDGRRAEQRLTGRGHGEGDEMLQQTFPSLLSDGPEGVVVGHLDLVRSTPTRGGRRRIGWASRGRPCLRISRCRTGPVRRGLVVFPSHAYSCPWAAVAARRRERPSAHLLHCGLQGVCHRGRASTAHMDVETWRACRDKTATVVLRPPGLRCYRGRPA
jgi:hypothetical protein